MHRQSRCERRSLQRGASRREEVAQWRAKRSTSRRLRKHIDYDSFGHLVNESFFGLNGEPMDPYNPQAIDQLFYYTGQEWDPDTKLQNNNARWYDPRMARFTSADPSGFDGGDPNLYRYVGNSPLNATDPTGLYTQLPTSYLPALSQPSLNYATGLSATDFSTFNSAQYTTSNQAATYFRGQEHQRSLYDPFYQPPQYTATDLSREVIRVNHLPQGSYTKKTTDDFGQTLIHARTPSGETYAFDPETGVRDDRVLQYLPSERGNNYQVFADPRMRTEIYEGPTTFELAIDAAAAFGGYFGVRAAARPLAQVAKNLAVNAYETYLETVVPGLGFLNGRPRPKNLDDLPIPSKPVAPGRGGPYGHIEDPPTVNSGRDFTPSQKRRILDENARRNGGVLRDDRTGEVLIYPQQRKKGVPAPPNEAQIDHVYPKSQGGPNTYSNAEVRTRRGNIQKGGKID
jgi:RHS repeat-associated protein